MSEGFEFNTRLVKEVEKHKCLYDWNLASYMDRDAQAAAWNSVGEAMNISVEDCKLKWKNLRGGLTRYLKARPLFEARQKTLKKYYLLDAMQFLIEFTKTRSHWSSRTNDFAAFKSNETELKILQSKLEPGASKIKKRKKVKSVGDKFSGVGRITTSPVDPNRIILKTEVEIADEEDQIDDDNDKVQIFMEGERQPIQKSSTDEQQFSSFVDPLSLHGIETLSFSNTSDNSNNPDLDFFKSILPDISAFSLAQKRRFKQEVLNIIEKISIEGS